MLDLVYVDPALMEGKLLRRAIFVKEIGSWVIQSEVPKPGNIDEYEQYSKEKILARYPELSELFEMEKEMDHTITFIKGINSGKWIDFHTR